MALDEKISLGRGWKRGGWREGGGDYPSYPGELNQSGDLTSLPDFADDFPTSKNKDLVIHVICFRDFNVACVAGVKRGRGIGKGEFGRARTQRAREGERKIQVQI